MEQIRDFLNSEQERYKKSHHKPLSKQRGQKVEKAISELLINKQSRSIGLDFLKSFPAENSANAVYLALNHLNEEDFTELYELIVQDEFFKASHGLKRYIMILEVIAQKNPEYSLPMLAELAQITTDHGKKPPSSQICKWVYQSLVKSRKLKNIIPYIERLSEKDKVHVGLLLLFSSVEQGMHKFGSIQDFVINEMQIKSLLGPILPEKIRVSLEEKLKDWSQEQKQKLVELGLILGLEQSHEVKSGNVDNQDNHKEHQFREKITRLQECIDRLHTDKEELAKKNAELKQNLEVNLEKCRKLESEIDLIKRELAEKKKIIITLSEKLNEAKQLLNEKEQELADQQAQFKEEIQRLIEMSEKESEFATKELKLRLGNKLRIEVEDFNEIKEDEMTIELGESLRYQINNIFNILRAEGILG